ncbi:glycosyltransferase [Allonocardiopsis opalescens]|uniref:Sterol 3beta-glucosyltransferase n=1 Tax=Allonocardiopsis opalescens TaxID=1144618 RepID=A0A2T0Q4S4_9ACTN|nr:glycosyltransferase [Allonocardiopsis opalescens]PRX98804.1 sterol 3beta-glucosyltransferase [Allonocardiopsis opalescens]
MRVVILTHGTRGDVQPYVALAKALLEAGHEALLGAPASAAALAEPHGVPFAPIVDEMNAFVEQPRVRHAMETNFRGLSGKRMAVELMLASRPAMIRCLAEMAEVAADGADVVVHMPGVPVHHVAEKMGVPAVPGALQPGWVPTGAFPNPSLPFTPPRALNRASYAPAQAFARILARYGDRLRSDLGLPGRPGSRDILRRPDGGPTTVLQGFSRHMLPAADPGYPPTVHTTGFWFLPAAPDWSPPAELEEFLAAGDPPVYIGFGSMVGFDPQKAGRIVTEAVRRAGVRAVLAGGWGGISLDRTTGEDIHLIDQAPHDWLFPRMAAVVHHGGSGTTGAALASGRPQVICPFLADQPFWAARAHAVGVAAPPQRGRDLSPEGLAEAIGQAATDPGMRVRAEEMGAKVRAEDGARAAVKVLETLV